MQHMRVANESKRDELIWALVKQDYRIVDIAEIFNMAHRSTVMRIAERMPKGWVSPWKKVVRE